MNLLKRYVLLFLLCCPVLGATVHAQKATISVSIDSAAILIGEQTVLHLAITADPGQAVRLLIPSETIMPGVEVLNVSPADSTIIDDRLNLKHDILITSFDSSLYLLPPIKAVINEDDTIYSNQVALKVSTIPVNIDKPDEFFDIKDVWKPPFVLADYYGIIYGILLGVFAICVIGYVIQRMRNRKNISEEIISSEPLLPPFEQAIHDLDNIKVQKLWQQGLNKQYYSILTEVLRRYIMRRFDVNAMEMTSTEILDALRRKDLSSTYDNLKQILVLSDYVKFAKVHPLPDEKELRMTNEYNFVNGTKPEEKPVEQDQSEETIETNNKEKE